MSQDMPGCLDDTTIAAFAGGLLSGAELERVDRHLAACSQCLWLVTFGALCADTPAELGALDFELPASSDRYEILEQIGEGGMGVVYRGHDRQTGRAVAIKQLKRDRLPNAPDIVSRFARESAILRRLSHPNIVKVLANIGQGPTRQIVMEYVPGGSLRQVLQVEGRLAPERASALLIEIGDALARAHHLEVIHRDIKPENVLLAADGSPRVADFGLARLAHQPSSSEHHLAGTLAYMSPEILSGGLPDESADLWALGVMLFEMLAGHLPFRGDNPAAVIAAIVHQPLPALEKACPEASAGLIDLTLRLLAREPKERPSARQVSAMLEALRKDRVPLEVPRSQAIAPTDYRPGAASQPRRPSALPAAATPFFGRSDEMAALRRLLAEPSARLVTILGPGGVGKSRLAIEVVRSLESLAPGAGEYRDGIYFIDLTTVSTPELLPSALGRALSVVLAPGGDAGEQLLERLRDKELLLLLDNFEHLVNAAGYATKLLQAAPRLKILATSREALRVSAETRFVLAGLAMPEALEHDASAVQLFVDCARRVRLDFDARAEWPAVARVCRLVQGMPLGIVLAAAWTGVLSSDEIAHEIEQSLDFVRADLRDLPDRQRSLRAVFEHSWNLLGADERGLFARLSVFRGGFARGAARAVAGATAEALAGLVAKSLLGWQPVAARFVMHELLREYGEAELRSRPAEKLQTMDRLAAYYADFLRDQQAALLGAEQPQAIVQITVELGNVNAAWQWMLDRRDLVGLEKALFGLALFHARCGSPGEVEATYDEVVRVFTPLEQGSQRAQKVLGIALLCQSVSCEYQGRNPAAMELLERAMKALSQAGECRERALALIPGGWILRDVQTADTRIASTEEGLAMYRKDGDLHSLALLLVQAARVCEGAADLPRAERHLRESIELQRSLHRGVIVLPSSLYGLGMLRGRQGAWREGYVLISEGLEAAERIGDKWSVAEALRHVALAQANLGDFSAAEAMTRRCIDVCREIGAQELHARCLSNLGDIAKRRGHLDQACDHYTEAFALTRGGSVERAGVDLNLGELALLRGRHDEAERHLVQGLGIFRARRVDWGIIIACDRLGILACHGGRHEAARQHFVQALGLALQARRWPLVLDVIAGLAVLYAGGRRDTRAVELLGLAKHHLATDKLTLALRVQPLLAELAERVAGPEFSAALERGKGLDLEQCARACAEDCARVSS